MAGEPRIRDLPSALDREGLRRRIGGRRPAVFLDYDGTLTPIVERPEDAAISEETRRAVEQLAGRCPVAVVSGRDLDDVRTRVGVEGIHYAGSHGFDILAPDGSTHQKARELLPALDGAEDDLRPLLEGIPGVRVERKRFAVAVHFRQTEESRVPEVEAAVDRVAGAHPELRKTGGKKIFELRPGLPWDKGKALLFVLEVLGLDRPDVVPIYVGDDETDEDAFRAIRDRGLGVVVRGEDDQRPTAAHVALEDPGEARGFLEELATMVQGSDD